MLYLEKNNLTLDNGGLCGIICIRKETKMNKLETEYKLYCLDHLKNFDCVPCEFEYKNKLYDGEWCWRMAKKLLDN